MRRLLFFLLFFISSFHAKSSDYDPAYFYYTNYSMWVYYGVSQTPMGACSKITHPEFGSGASVIRDSPNVWSCMSSFIESQDSTMFLGQVFRGACPNHPICSQPPPPDPNNCPSSGTPVTVVNRLNWGESGLDQPITVGGARSINGCEVVPLYTDVACDSDETIRCNVITGNQYTGNQTPTNEPIPEIDSDDILESEPSFEPIGVKPAESSVNVERDTITMPDGTMIETETTVTNEVRGVGTDRVENEQVTVVQMSNGITKTETTVQTTITNPDGSKAVQTETVTTYTNNGVETFTVQKPLGPVTNSATAPVSSSTTNTTINNYGPDGKLTSSESSSSSTGDQVGGGSGSGSGQGGDCEGLECEDVMGGPEYQEGGSWWESSYPDGLAGIFETHKEALIQASMIGVITDTAGISANGSFPLFTFPGYSIGPMSVPASQIELDSRVVPFMRIAFLFIAAVVCRRLIFGG